MLSVKKKLKIKLGLTQKKRLIWTKIEIKKAFEYFMGRKKI